MDNQTLRPSHPQPGRRTAIRLVFFITQEHFLLLFLLLLLLFVIIKNSYF
jgi:hypothetical protein